MSESEENQSIRKPKVTIGVCVRNCEGTVKDAIESILSQDYPHELMEVIFIDDGSTDGTLRIIKEYAKKMDMKVKIFRHKWRGLGYSRNVVVNNACGKYIIWVDGDMIIPKDHVTKQVEFMELHPRVGIAKARYALLPTDSTIAVLENVPFIILQSKNQPLNTKLPGTGGAIFRVSVVRKVGGFDNNLFGAGEDLDITFRIMSSGWQIKTSSAIFYERNEQNWKDLWRKYFWYGYGNYFLYRKNKSIFKVYKMVPPASFLAGILCSFPAYRLLRLKAIFFLLPLCFFYKSWAWCLGFTYAHLHLNTRK